LTNEVPRGISRDGIDERELIAPVRGLTKIVKVVFEVFPSSGVDDRVEAFRDTRFDGKVLGSIYGGRSSQGDISIF
jgi:hypothetical protein